MLTRPPGATPDRARAGRITTPSIGLDAMLGHFAGLYDDAGLLLAVSGGPDSMALLLVAARWKSTLGSVGPAVHVATVDHGLRAESRAEAEQVASLAADLDLPHTILTWLGPKPATRIQERARNARYDLLADHARAIGADHILTAHHADDQAETILLRLGRGSGITGLAGMRRVTALSPGIRLVRPFLEVPKADLVAICRAEACAYIDDPSNRDAAYARPRLRAQRQALQDAGLDTPGLLRLSRRLSRAEAALDAETDRIETLLAPDRTLETYRADLTKAGAVPDEIALRLLGRAIAHVCEARPIRLERLESLTESLANALREGRAHRATIAGTRVVLGRDRILTITPEGPRRRGLPAALPEH